MPLYLNQDQQELLFLHIPKTGGSSVEQLLKLNASGGYLYSTKQLQRLCTPQHLHRQVLTAMFDDPDIASFTLVRNPYLRLISEYKYQIKRGMFKRDELSFDQFITSRLSAYSQDPYAYDNHFRPMQEFILPTTRVFKLEQDIDKLEDYLSSFLKKTVCLPHINQASLNGELEVSQATLDLILHTYECDFAAFDYERSTISLVNNGTIKIVNNSVATDIQFVKTRLSACQDKLNATEIDLLRNSALLFEQYDMLEPAKKLMALASKYRPEGDFISSKVQDYQTKLKSREELAKSTILPIDEAADPQQSFFNSVDSKKRIKSLGHRGFVGGVTADLWYEIGKLQYYFLIEQGLKPQHQFLDIGCGSLRLGQFIIPYLEPSNYIGLDAEPELVKLGLQQELSPQIIKQKKPHFLYNSGFDFTAINGFDVAIAQSLFTHLNREDIKSCLVNLRRITYANSRFYFTFFEGDSSENKFEQSHANRGFCYSQSELAELAKLTGWDFNYIGGWKHPKNQKMVLLTPTNKR